MAYRPGLPPALKDVSFVVPAGTKLGVVGRTGAGKTSLLAALFRLVELSAGRIIIDGVDVAGLGLGYRSRLGVVSQEAALFSGSVRANVDPGGTLPDAAVWVAAARVAAGGGRPRRGVRVGGLGDRRGGAAGAAVDARGRDAHYYCAPAGECGRRGPGGGHGGGAGARGGRARRAPRPPGRGVRRARRRVCGRRVGPPPWAAGHARPRPRARGWRAWGPCGPPAGRSLVAVAVCAAVTGLYFFFFLCVVVVGGCRVGWKQRAPPFCPFWSVCFLSRGHSVAFAPQSGKSQPVAASSRPPSSAATPPPRRQPPRPWRTSSGGSGGGRRRHRRRHGGH